MAVDSDGWLHIIRSHMDTHYIIFDPATFAYHAVRLNFDCVESSLSVTYIDG